MDTDQWERLAAVREQTGIPIAEQIRRAVDDWLKHKDGYSYPEVLNKFFPNADLNEDIHNPLNTGGFKDTAE